MPESAVPPPLPDYLFPYLESPGGYFWELSTDRPFGMSAVGPIPWSSKDRYARGLGLEDEDLEDFVFLISALDEVYLKVQAERAEQERKKKKPRK